VSHPKGRGWPHGHPHGLGAMRVAFGPPRNPFRGGPKATPGVVGGLWWLLGHPEMGFEVRAATPDP
jgi:hypothetical protein